MHCPTLPATLQLGGVERARYFAPVALCAFLAALCLGVVTASFFLEHIPDAQAITVAGCFGLVLTGGAAGVLLHLQLRWLRYTPVPLRCDPLAAFVAIERTAEQARWRITRAVPGESLRARTGGGVFSEGELVAVELRPGRMWLASICDPGIGFSLVGHARCRGHLDRLRSAVLAVPEPAPAAN